jgi:hypothetical protein
MRLCFCKSHWPAGTFSAYAQGPERSAFSSLINAYRHVLESAQKRAADALADTLSPTHKKTSG